jgi:hypothetical protein
MPESYDRGFRPTATQSDWISYDRTARDTVAQMLVEDDSGITGTNQVHVRNITPQWDLNAGDDSSWNGTDTIWTQGTSGATSAGDTVEVYQLDNSQDMDEKTAVIYGIRHLAGGSLTDNASQLIFTNTTGGEIERFDLSQLDVAAEEDYRALIENPIRLRQSGSVNIELVAQSDLSSNDPELQLLGAVGEEAGENLEESSKFVATA